MSRAGVRILGMRFSDLSIVRTRRKTDFDRIATYSYKNNSEARTQPTLMNGSNWVLPGLDFARG